MDGRLGFVPQSRLLIPIGGLRRISEKQNRKVAASGELFSCGFKVSHIGIGFADSIIAEKAIGRPSSRPCRC
jgi:hypothetical protein